MNIIPVQLLSLFGGRYNRLFLYLIALGGLLSGCSSQTPTFSPKLRTATPRATKPVIDPLQILLNKDTLLEFRPFFNVRNPQLTEQVAGELIYISGDIFNHSLCRLNGLPPREKHWFGLLKLNDECSSVQTVVRILQSTKSFNSSTLQGFVFYLNDLDNIPVSNYSANTTGTHLGHSTDALLFLYSNSSFPLR